MKKALSLVEVLVSIVIITFVISAILKIEQNNLFYLSKSQKTIQNNNYLFAVVDNEKVNDGTKYLDDSVNFHNDIVRKKLKNIKVKIKTTELDNISLPENNYIPSIKVYQTSYSIITKQNTTTTNLYRFEF